MLYFLKYPTKCLQSYLHIIPDAEVIKTVQGSSIVVGTSGELKLGKKKKRNYQKFYSNATFNLIKIPT